MSTTTFTFCLGCLLELYKTTSPKRENFEISKYSFLCMNFTAAQTATGKCAPCN